MKIFCSSALAFALLTAPAGAVKAAPIVLTFEGLQNNEAVQNYYAGDFGGNGSGSGPNYRITLGSDSLALVNGNFANNASCNTVLYFLSGLGDILNDAPGFTTGFSF